MPAGPQTVTAVGLGPLTPSPEPRASLLSPAPGRGRLGPEGKQCVAFLASPCLSFGVLLQACVLCLRVSFFPSALPRLCYAGPCV